MNKKIFIVSHKDIELPNNELYTPIIVGNKEFKIPNDYYRDDTYDNISIKNSNYCELTALYWIWKNVNDYDIVGLCHYRRYFVEKMEKNFKVLLTSENIEKYLKKYDIILPQKRYFLKKKVKEQYCQRDNAFKKDYELLSELIQQIEPSYIEAFKKVSNSNSTYLYNMFIAKKELLNNYCEWLFNILFELERGLDISNYSAQQRRVYGYLAERLMTVYVIKNKLKVKEVNVLNFEKNLKEEKKIMLKNKIKRIFIK